ncbi:MAG TPA: PqqD family protein [Bryobacteraceae bacterium]|jgi:hypothetical protein
MKKSPLGPLARKEDLTIEDLPSETVVYDRTRNRMHCLNRSTSFIWKRCNGDTKVEEIAAQLPEVGLPADLDLVRRALKALDRAHLLAGGPASFDAALPSRRQLVQRLGLAAGTAAALLPAITSAVAPTPAMAKSKDDHDKPKKPKKAKKSDLRFD